MCVAEKDLIAKQLNVISVAHERSKKELKENAKSYDQKIDSLKNHVLRLQEFKEQKQAEEKLDRKRAKKVRQKEKKELLIKESNVRKDVENDPIEILERNVKNSFNSLQDIDLVRESNNIVPDDKVKDAKDFTEPNLSSSSDLNQNKPPDIDNAAPESETKDNVLEMSAEELSKFSSDCVANFRLRQGF